MIPLNRRSWYALACSLLFLASGWSGTAAEVPWKVGLAQVKITPERPVYLEGYAARSKPHERVEHDLYLKAMVLEDRSGTRAVIVTADLIGFRPPLVDPVCRRIEQEAGIPRSGIFLNASHTHCGPMLVYNLSPKRASDPAAKENFEYTRRLEDRFVQVVGEATRSLEPARLSYGVGVAPFVMNRREFIPGGVKIGMNPSGLVDRAVPVLRVDGADGEPRAVVFGAACHNTTMGSDVLAICGDYAGFAQAALGEKLPGVQAMFVQGCGADANPYPRGTMELARQHGQTLAQEVLRVMETKLKAVDGPLSLQFATLQIPMEPMPPRETLQQWAGQRSGWEGWAGREMLAMLDRGESIPSHLPCPVSLWQFGDTLTLVGLSGEVVVDYVPLLRDAIGPLNLWLAGYSHDVFGYVPSVRILKEGGYESRGIDTEGVGLFAPGTQEVIVEGVRDLARKAGRKGW